MLPSSYLNIKLKIISEYLPWIARSNFNYFLSSLKAEAIIKGFPLSISGLRKQL